MSSRRRDRYVLVDSEEGKTEDVATPIAVCSEEEEDIPVAVPITVDTEAVSASEPRMAILLNFLKVKMSSDNREYKIDFGSEVNAFRDTTVSELRDKIATLSGVPPDRQRLIYVGKIIVSDGVSLESVGLSTGQCVICCPRVSSTSSFEVDGNNDPEADDRATRIRRILGFDEPDDAFLSETVPYSVIRAANAAKFVAAFLFFYYTITFIFSLALIFRSEEVHEEIANVNDDQGDASLPGWYVVMCTVIRPPQALFGMLVAYGGLKAVNLMSLKLTNRFLCGIMILAMFELITSFDVSKRDVDKNNETVNIVFSIGIFALFWGFCIRAVHRFKSMLSSHIASRRPSARVVVSI